MAEGKWGKQADASKAGSGAGSDGLTLGFRGHAGMQNEDEDGAPIRALCKQQKNPAMGRTSVLVDGSHANCV